MDQRQSHNGRIARARSLRKSPTKSEGILWSLLRAKQVCGLKFRRQHPIGPWYADFACPDRMLVVEIDGGYHDHTIDRDRRRQDDFQRAGWQVIRFTDESVEEDAEAVVREIARTLNDAYRFESRKATGSGKKHLELGRRPKDF